MYRVCIASLTATAIMLSGTFAWIVRAPMLSAQSASPKPNPLALPVGVALDEQRSSRLSSKVSPQMQVVLDRLGDIQPSSKKTWQYHPGDVPHGERVDLDTTGWQTIHMPYMAPRGAVWVRRWIEVPKTLHGYDLTGAQIWFHMRAWANGPIPMILYYNGRRVAMGEDLEKQILFSDAKPGDKVLVAVKMLVTQDEKYLHKGDLAVVFRRDRPNPEDVRDELISAANLLPAITKNPSTLAAQEKILEDAATSINLAALDAGNQDAFDASLRQAQGKLEALRPALQAYTVHLTGNSHIDAAWLWPWIETVDVVKRTFSTALQLMREYPDYTYTQSAAQYDEWMQQKYPSIFQQIQQRVKEGRWEMVGGMWVEPDLNLPDGESQVRQILLGKRYFQKNFGINVRVGWNPDSFGYNWQLPQIYKKSGIDYFVTQKMAWNDTTQLPLKLFWWQAPDGSRVLTYFPHEYGNSIAPIWISNDLAAAVNLNPGQKEMMHLYGVSDHGGGPTRDMLDSGMRWMEPNKVFPRMEFGTAKTFFDTMSKRVDTADAPVWNYETLAAGKTHLPAAAAGKISLPVWNDEMYLEMHRGTYTTQARQKWNLRHSSEWLLNAEKYSSLAWLGGLPYPGTQLTEAWKLVSFNGFHDLAAGSAVGADYEDAQKQFDVVHWTANTATRNALSDIDSHIDTSGKGISKAGVPIILWNTLSWNRADIVEVDVQMPQAEPQGISVLDADNKPVPMQILSQDSSTHSFHLLLEPANVPSMGYTVLHAVAGARKVESDLKTNGTVMENSVLRVVVNQKTGCIDSLYDKQSHFESITAGQCGNLLQAFVDPGNAWNVHADFARHGTDLTMADSVQLVEQGPVRSVVRVTRHWSKSTFVQNIVLYAGMRRVDVVNDVDWQETHILLKAAFPLAASGPKATFEIPYGTIERPTTRNNPVEDAKFEVPAQRWADLGDGAHGFSLINDAKYGYDVKGNVLRLSLLRAPTFPDPNVDRGHQHFRYSLYPHAGTWRQADTVLRGYAFNYRLRAMQVEAHTGELPPTRSFVAVQPENLVLTAMKKSEDGNGLILRFYEWAGRKTNATLTLPTGATAAIETNLMEHADGSPLAISGDHVTIPVGPYSINTVRIHPSNRGADFWQTQK